MFQSIVDLVTSNKFKVMFFSILALVCAHFSGPMISWSEVFNNGWPIVVAWMGAQGLADIGKNKVVFEQRELRRRELSAPKEVPVKQA